MCVCNPSVDLVWFGFAASTDFLSIEQAERDLLKKMSMWHKLRYIARFDVADGDAERVAARIKANAPWNA